MNYIIVGSLIFISNSLLALNWFLTKGQTELLLLIAGAISLLLSIFFLTKEALQVKSVYQMLITLKSKVDALSGVSDQISSTSSNLSEGATEQAEGLQQTVSAMDEINATVQRNRDFTEESKSETQQCLKSVTESSKLMNELKVAFSTIKNGNLEFEEFVKNNNQKFDEIKTVISDISEKTQVINDIVFQTKLLAFNASVEAARAGEHGKGFSVVAEEVGNLATMSGTAANEISEMLETGLGTVNKIVDETTTSVEGLVRDATKNIEKGEGQVENSLIAFDEISNRVATVTDKISEISNASNEQSIGVQEISKAINMLEQNNQRSALVAKQAFEISVSLNEEFNELESEFTSIFNTIYKKGETPKIDLKAFDWNDKFLLKVDKMDEEHKILIGKINKLVVSLNGAQQSEMENNFIDLRDYTVLHFSDEEDFMRSIQYPDFEAHSKIHENMLAQFGTYEKALFEGSLNKKKFVAFLKNWLVSHILGVDMQYADFSRQN